jgi:hypothetical protein
MPMRQGREGSDRETAPRIETSRITIAPRHAHAPAAKQPRNKQASTMRGKHQGERADQGGEQEEMLMLGVLQSDCELIA